MLGMQAQEAVDRAERQRALAVLVVRPGDLDLRLLRPAAEGIAGFELAQELDRLRVVRRGHFVLGLCI